MIFLPVGSGDQVAASFESTIQNNRYLPRLGLLARPQDVQIDGSQVTRRRMKGILDLLGNHGPELAGRRKQPGELGQVDRMVTAQKDHDRAGDFRRTCLRCLGQSHESHGLDLVNRFQLAGTHPHLR